MGLIAGIYSKIHIPDLKDKIMNMIKAQPHRDLGQPEVHMWGNLAVGMSNKHNTIFTKNYPNHYSNLKKEELETRAFIDGIVLETQKHADFFNNKGYKVASPLCSTVLALAYEEWGLDLMDHLEGEFACSIVDKKENKTVLLRDTVGKKPLHYFWDGTTFLFSSEIKGLIAGGAPAEIDYINLSDFLTLNCIPYPATIFKNIFQVPPGSMIIFKNNEIEKKTYWHPQFNIDESISLNDIVEQMTIATRDAVKKRMFSDDIYCFLSGGIDSSAIVSFASELSSKPIHTISVGFAEEEKNELEDAAIMAKHVGAIHHQVIASPDSFFDMLDTLVFNHDSPFSDTSAYPTFFAGKLASQFTDLILTGDGPDQTMGGSGHHVFAVKNNLFSSRNPQKQLLAKYSAQLLNQITIDPSPTFMSKVQRNLYRKSVSPVHAAYDLRSYFPDIVKQHLCTDELWEVHKKNDPYRHPDSWFREAGNVDDINKYLYADRKFYVPDDLMIKVDRMCMAHSLETLSPMNDSNLLKLIDTLPGNYKVNVSENGEITTKYILKKVCQNRFPEHTLLKKKQGFGIPLEKWLRQDNGKIIKEILLDNRTLSRGYFNNKSIEKLVNAFINGEGDFFFASANGIVELLTLELWHRRYID